MVYDCLGLDPFGDDFEVEASGQRNEGFSNG